MDQHRILRGSSLAFLLPQICIILMPSSDTEGTYFRYLRRFNSHHTVNARLRPVVRHLKSVPGAERAHCLGLFLRERAFPAVCSRNLNACRRLATDRTGKSQCSYHATQRRVLHFPSELSKPIAMGSPVSGTLLKVIAPPSFILSERIIVQCIPVFI